MHVRGSRPEGREDQQQEAGPLIPALTVIRNITLPCAYASAAQEGGSSFNEGISL